MGWLMRFESSEALIAALLDLRAKEQPERACLLVRASLAALGHPFTEEHWETFFDPEESFANAMYDCGTALWELDWSDRDDIRPQAAVLAFEASAAAGLELAGFALAQSLDWLGDPRAEAVLRDFVSRHPDWEDPRLFGILGGLIADRYDDEEHMDEALACLDRVGDSEDIWVCWRALAIAKLGHVEDAIALLGDQVTADDPDALAVLGDIHRWADDVERAQEAYLRAIAVGDARSARMLGNLLHTLGDDAAARQAYEIAAARGDGYATELLRDPSWELPG
jgi:tetratricopeptide (TPR) repeat protein